MRQKGKQEREMYNRMENIPPPLRTQAKTANIPLQEHTRVIQAQKKCPKAGSVPAQRESVPAKALPSPGSVGGYYNSVLQLCALIWCWNTMVQAVTARIPPYLMVQFR